MARIVTSIHSFYRDEGGVSSVEYALMLALVAGGITIAAFALGTSVAGEFNEATDCIEVDTCTS